MSRQSIFLKRAKVDKRRARIGSERRKKFNRLRNTKQIADYYINRFKAKAKDRKEKFLTRFKKNV